MADIEETFHFSLLVAGAGIIGLIVGSAAYPPLGSYSWVGYMIPALILIPAAIAFALYHFDRLTRYATLVRLMVAMAAFAFVIPGAYYFLNGILDGNPPVVAQALVSKKYINHGRGATYNLIWTLSWHGERAEQGTGVSRESFDATEPGDSVRVVIHPGEFSQPWYSDVLLSSSDTRNSK
jgi:hypothetical protein